MEFLKKIPAVGKFIHMLLNSRKAQVLVMGLIASVLIKHVGMEGEQAAELSIHIFYGCLAWAGYIAIEDHGRNQGNGGGGHEEGGAGTDS